MSMYKKRNIIRITATVVFLALAGLIYFISKESPTSADQTATYVLGGIALAGAVFYFIQMRQFKGKLNNYFKQKNNEV